MKGINRSLKKADNIKIQLSFNEEVDFISDLNQFGNDADGNDIELEHVFTKDEIHKLFQPYYQKKLLIIPKN